MTMLADQPPPMACFDVWLSFKIKSGASGMMPVHSRAMEGPSVDLIKKAKHQNMFAPSLGRPSLWLLSLGRARESDLLSGNPRLKCSSIAIATQ